MKSNMKSKNGILKIVILIVILSLISVLCIFFKNMKKSEELPVKIYYDIGNGPLELLENQIYETEYNAIVTWESSDEEASIKKDGIEVDKIKQGTKLIESGTYEINVKGTTVKLKIQKNTNVSVMFNIISNEKGNAVVKFNEETVTSVIIYNPDGSIYGEVTDLSQEYKITGKRGETYLLLINNNYNDSISLM